MSIITSKTSLRPILNKGLEIFRQKGEDDFVQFVHQQLLKKKIRFPLLEYATRVFVQEIPARFQYSLAQKIMDLNTIGGNVLVGIFLQEQLSKNLSKALQTANQHIVQGDLWYVCDIIGERVTGVALLTQPEKTISHLRKMSRHENKWVVRTVGVATHYAVKKGLRKKYAGDMFTLLLSLGNTTDFHTKKGIGWAAKTIAKFHPDIIQQYQKELSDPAIKPWFKTKIRIGLGRSEKYASRYNS